MRRAKLFGALRLSGQEVQCHRTIGWFEAREPPARRAYSTNNLGTQLRELKTLLPAAEFAQTKATLLARYTDHRPTREATAPPAAHLNHRGSNFIGAEARGLLAAVRAGADLNQTDVVGVIMRAAIHRAWGNDAVHGVQPGALTTRASDGASELAIVEQHPYRGASYTNHATPSVIAEALALDQSKVPPDRTDAKGVRDEGPSAEHMQLNKRIQDSLDGETILTIVQAEHGNFDASNAATACIWLARIGPRTGIRKDDRRLQTLFSTVARLSPGVSAELVAKTLRALAALEWRPEASAMRTLEALAVQRAARMGSWELTNILRALVVLEWHVAEGSMCALQGTAARLAPSMNAHELAMALRALAMLDWQILDGSMRPALERAAVLLAPRMKPQDVANTLWALATLEWQAAAGSRSVLEGAVARAVPGMNAPDLARTLWSLAILEWQAEIKTRSALERAMARAAPSMTAQDVANSLLALATLGWQLQAEAMRALERAAAQQGERMTAQDVANALCAMAQLEWKAEAGAMRTLEAAAVRLAPGMSGQEVSNTLWALAKLGWQAETFLLASYARGS